MSDNNTLPFTYEALALLPLPLLTIFGNVLVVLAVYRERSLRTSTNCILVSLAIADLLVALIVMPFSIYYWVTNFKWYLSDWLCSLFVVADVSASSASIIHLMAVSADRCFAVTRHMDYRTEKHKKFVAISIALCWLFSVALGLPVGVGLNIVPSQQQNFCGIDNSDFMLYGSLFAFYIPCIIMVIMYSFVFYKLRKRLQAVKQQEIAAGHLVSGFGTNLEEIMSAANGGLQNIRRNTVNWALPWTSTTPVTALNDTESLSSEDIQELTSVLCKIEQSTTSEVQKSTKDTVGVYGVSHGSDKANHREKSTKPVRSRSRRIQRQVSQRARRVKGQLTRMASRIPIPSRKESMVSATSQLRKLKERAADLFTKMRTPLGKAIRKETKATKLVATVMVIFLLCWSPFFSLNVLKVVRSWKDSTYVFPPAWETLFVITTWLGYLNSCLNPIIYSVINRRFRLAFQRLLRIRTHDTHAKRKKKTTMLCDLEKRGVQAQVLNAKPLEEAAGNEFYENDGSNHCRSANCLPTKEDLDSAHPEELLPLDTLIREDVGAAENFREL